MGWVTCTWQGHRRRYDRQDQGLTFILRKRRRQPPVVWWSYLAKTYGGAPAWYTTNHPVHIMVWSTLNMQSSKCHDKCLDSITVFTNRPTICVKRSHFFRVPLRSRSLSKKGVALPYRSFWKKGVALPHRSFVKRVHSFIALFFVIFLKIFFSLVYILEFGNLQEILCQVKSTFASKNI